jgi:MoaA/NifB/PqqE/SkfB family radical SAM enzyme
MRVTNAFKRSKLDLDEVKRIIDAAAQKGVQMISFTGGEPLLFLDELSRLMQYAGQAGIRYVRTGTNGFIFRKADAPDFESKMARVAETLALTPLRNFWISIDSAVPEIHEKMRGLPGVVAGIEKALPIFHAHGLYPSANLGLNRNVAGPVSKLPVMNTQGDPDDEQAFYHHFREALSQFYRFVIRLGFTMVNSCYPMSIPSNDPTNPLRPVYPATSEAALVRFSGQEKALLYKALFDTIPEFRSKIRIFSPRTSLYALYMNQGSPSNTPYPCRGGIDFFFIDSKDGNTYPCGYRGHEDLGKYWDLGGKPTDESFECRQCDWECFRDPSELFGPLLQGFSRPLSLLKKYRWDPRFFQLWLEDIKYYRATDFFDGRQPPDYGRLRRFETG